MVINEGEVLSSGSKNKSLKKKHFYGIYKRRTRKMIHVYNHSVLCCERLLWILMHFPKNSTILEIVSLCLDNLINSYQLTALFA